MPVEFDHSDPPCSFCQARRAEVRKLIVSKYAAICDVCLDLCAAVVAVEPPAADASFDEPEASAQPVVLTGDGVDCALCGNHCPPAAMLWLDARRGSLCRECQRTVEWALRLDVPDP